jgi:hypothetical protein
MAFLPRAVQLPALLGSAIVLSGCVLSVEPVVPQSSATFDARLVGTWEEASGTDRAVVSRTAEGSYRIEYTSGGKVATFAARLGQLGKRPVLDVWPERSVSDPAPDTGLLLPGHLLLALEADSDEIRVLALDPDSLLAALRAGKVRLTYRLPENRLSENRLILTSTTEQLRSALADYIARSGALGKPEIWRRVPSGALGRPAPVDVPCFEASAWREADELFHRDPHWLGADVASSVDLGGGRTLWLFGDTWVDSSGTGRRQGARMVSNSVAIQTGADPTKAKILFYWGRAADGSPAPLFPDRGAESLWFGNGVRVGDRLVLFFARTLRNTGTGLGFEHVGSTAVIVENPDAEPSAWQVRPLELPHDPLGILIGFATVTRSAEHVYAFGSQKNGVRSHPMYAVRWPVEQVRLGNLLHPEWWAGDRLGWAADSSAALPWPLLENGSPDLAFHVDQASGRFLEIHTQGFGPADLAMRAAPALTGPWSEPRTVYRPPEYYRPHVMIYSSKTHAQLAGADLVLTYATNSFEFTEHLTDPLIYYPRFVRLTRCK